MQILLLQNAFVDAINEQLHVRRAIWMKDNTVAAIDARAFMHAACISANDYVMKKTTTLISIAARVRTILSTRHIVHVAKRHSRRYQMHTSARTALIHRRYAIKYVQKDFGKRNAFVVVRSATIALQLWH